MGLKLRRSELNIDLTLGSNVDLLYRLKNMNWTPSWSPWMTA